MDLTRPVGEIKFDLDGVLINFSHIAKGLLNSAGYSVNNSNGFAWTTTPELSNNQIWKFFKQAYTLWRVTPIFDGAAELTTALYHRTGKPISVITARPISYATETHLMVERVIEVPYTIAITPGAEKHAHLEPNDVIVEDRRRTVLQLAEIGIRSILIDRPYNQIESPPDQVHRVSGLPEIQEMLPVLLPTER